jgi:hypothetical protein
MDSLCLKIEADKGRSEDAENEGDEADGEDEAELRQPQDRTKESREPCGDGRREREGRVEDADDEEERAVVEEHEQIERRDLVPLKAQKLAAHDID